MRLPLAAASLLIILSACSDNAEQTTSTVVVPAKTDATISDVKTAGLKGAVRTANRRMFKKFGQDSNKVWRPAGKKVTYYLETYDSLGNKTIEHNILNKDTLRILRTTYTNDNERTMVMSNPGGPMAIQVVNYDGNVSKHKIYQIKEEDTTLVSSFTKTYKPDGRSFVSQENDIENGNLNGKDLTLDIKVIDDTITSVQNINGQLNVTQYTVLERDQQGNITKQLFKSDASKDYDILTIIDYTYYE